MRKLWDGEWAAQPGQRSQGWARKVYSILQGSNEGEQHTGQSSERREACRDQDCGGTLWIQCFSPILHLVGLDQVNVEQFWSGLACRAQQEEQWIERTRFKVENRHGDGEGATPA